ncbi:hypothetical protein Hanom_Chr05g00472621 [Helianthus anomalus]
MILNDIYNSFFLFHIRNLIYFRSITYFLYFFVSMCAFLKKAHPFFAPSSERVRCASSAPCVFDNIGFSASKMLV